MKGKITMVRRNAAIGWAVLGLALLAAYPVAAQDSDRRALRAQIEDRFDVLPLKDGVVLRPQRPVRDLRSIQLSGGDIAIDGELVTGAEVRRRLGSDGDLVIRLSYLSAGDQRSLFGRSAESFADPNGPAVPRRGFGPRRFQRRDAVVRMGGNVRVENGETVTGDVVVIGGSVNIDGTVRGEVVCVAGNAELGPNADINGDLTVVAGTLTRDPAARVSGQIHEVGWGDMPFFQRGNRQPEFRTVSPFLRSSNSGRWFALVSSVARFLVLCGLASLAFLFARGYVERVGNRAASEPLKAGLVGFLLQLLFVPLLVVTVVVLVVTIIGIPLLVLIPFALLAAAVLWLVGFSAVAHDVGRVITHKFGWQASGPYLQLAVGVLTLLLPVLVGGIAAFGGTPLAPVMWALFLLGLIVEYAAWTVGLGAIALLRFDPR